MTSHSTGPFDPIAEAPDPEDPQAQPEQPSGHFSGPPGGPPTGAFTGLPSTPFTGPPSLPPAGAFTGHPSGPLRGAFTGPQSGPFSGPPGGPLPVAAEAHHEPGRPGGDYRAKVPARDRDAASAQAVDDDQLWAMMAYLGVIFFAFLPPLAVYVLRRRESRYVRFHAAQALNLWITAFLYTVSFMIIGGVLALDSISTALAVGIPLIVAAGIAMLLFAVRAAVAAGRGVRYEIPSWICVPMVT
jgi:uncharacterized Tic20 family protein